MEKLGIVVDALEIQEIEDSSGYINNLAAPHAAAVASQARIAQAKADQQAAEQEQQAEAMKAQYDRDLAIKRAGFLAETEEAKARAGAGRPAGRGPGVTGSHRGADRAGPAPGRAGRPAAGSRGAAAGRRRGLPAAHAGRGRAGPGQIRHGRGSVPGSTLAKAEAEAAKIRADATAYTERATAKAEADANRPGPPRWPMATRS